MAPNATRAKAPGMARGRFVARASGRGCRAGVAQAALKRAARKKGGTARKWHSHSTRRTEQRERTLLGKILEITENK